MALLVNNVRGTVRAALGLFCKAATATYYTIYSIFTVKDRVIPEVEKLINPPAPVKRKRGRPRKTEQFARPKPKRNSTTLIGPKRKPGRPRKQSDVTAVNATLKRR